MNREAIKEILESVRISAKANVLTDAVLDWYVTKLLALIEPPPDVPLEHARRVGYSIAPNPLLLTERERATIWKEWEVTDHALLEDLSIMFCQAQLAKATPYIDRIKAECAIEKSQLYVQMSEAMADAVKTERRKCEAKIVEARTEERAKLMLLSEPIIADARKQEREKVLKEVSLAISLLKETQGEWLSVDEVYCPERIGDIKRVIEILDALKGKEVKE